MIATRENTFQKLFEVLRNPEEHASPELEEGEVQQNQGLVMEENKYTAAQDLPASLVDDSTSPTYA